MPMLEAALKELGKKKDEPETESAKEE